MSVRYVCDGGCGFVSDDHSQFKAIGVINKGHYCAGCTPKAEAYLSERDQMHNEIAASFRKKRDALAKKHAKGVAKLPDEPNA